MRDYLVSPVSLLAQENIWFGSGYCSREMSVLQLHAGSAEHETGQSQISPRAAKLLSGNREENEVKKLLIWIIDFDLYGHFSPHRLSPSILGLTEKNPDVREMTSKGTSTSRDDND